MRLILIFTSVFQCMFITTKASESVMIHIPFNIEIDPMERLLLVNFENDPDTLYVGFEPQVFDDAVNGKGHLVIGWRKDGRVDVYHEAGLKLDPAKYDIAGKGLANMVEREMSSAFFEITDHGVQAEYCFRDIHDRLVHFRIAEKHPGKRKPFGLLAPMGAAAENPSAMPLVLLHDFYFVRQKHSDIEVSINGKSHQVDRLPIPMDFRRMTFIRYSPEPLIAMFNPAFTGTMPSVELPKGNTRLQYQHQDIFLEWKQDKAFIKQITFNNDTYPIELLFDKPFPVPDLLDQGFSQTGSFSIRAHPSTGRISGQYAVEMVDEQIKIVMIPDKGWRPQPNKLSLRFLYTVARIFKHWPKTYEWTAHIEKDNQGFRMTSAWKRIK